MTTAEALHEVYARHTDRVRDEVETYWARLGGRPSFEGSRVLDVGCGNGLLAVDAAARGARRVMGVDIEEELVAFARQDAAARAPHLTGVLDFQCRRVEELPPEPFDMILSKDVLEHVLALEDTFGAMVRLLAPGGRMYLGFGPLWRSPFGGHALNRLGGVLGGLSLPWAHLVLPESLLIRLVNRGRLTPVRNIAEYGLNQLPYERYDALIRSSGPRVLSYRVNVSDNPLARVAGLLRRLPLVGDYFTSTVYCILEKTCA